MHGSIPMWYLWILSKFNVFFHIALVCSIGAVGGVIVWLFIFVVRRGR